MPEQNDQGQQGQPASQANSSTPAPSQNPSGTPGENQQPPAGQLGTQQQQQGEKLFAGKYKTPEDLEKGYNESTKYAREQAALVKDLQGKLPKAPDKYVFDYSKVPEMQNSTLDESSPDLAPLIPVFKELNLNQEQVDKLVQTWVKTQQSLLLTKDQIMEGLGANASVIQTRLQEYTNKLPAEDQQIVSMLSDDPKVIDFMYRHLVGEEQQIPAAGQGGSSAPTKTAAELKTEAFKYKSENANSIGWDKGQQDTYQKMLNVALLAEDNERKNKK